MKKMTAKECPNCNLLCDDELFLFEEQRYPVCYHCLEQSMKGLKRICRENRCLTSASFGWKKGYGIRCLKHKSQEMINVTGKTCKESNCSLQPNFNYASETRAIYCSKHKKPQMINIYSKRCLEDGCNSQPIYNYSTTKVRAYCLKHKKEGMVDVAHKTCEEKDCLNRAYYSSNGSKTPMYCSIHKKQEMTHSTKRLCIEKGCDKSPSFNFANEEKSLYCSKHKKDGMINIETVYCSEELCRTVAWFNYEGCKDRLYCAKHKKDGMINISTYKMCKIKDCSNRALYNFLNEKEALYCIEHKAKNMINIYQNRCQYEGCLKIPCFNEDGNKTGIYCSEHKTSSMIDVINKLCSYDECIIHATYGIPSNLSTRCFQHKLEGMIPSPRKKCQHCSKRAEYGDSRIQQRCEEHKQDGDMNLILRKCIKCGDIDVVDSRGWCVNTCCLEEQFHQFKTHQKRKENSVNEYLDECFEKASLYDKRLPQSCFRDNQRPDRYHDFGTHSLIVEVDEHQHSGDAVCQSGKFKTKQEEDVQRMKNLFYVIGEQKPLIFIRYNPDSIKNNGVYKNISEKKRFETLLYWCNKFKQEPPCDGWCYVIYLFYNDKEQILSQLDVSKG